jgi:tight adherence protein B
MTPTEILVVVFIVAGAGTALHLWRSARLKRLCIERLNSGMMSTTVERHQGQTTARLTKPFPRRYRYAGPVAGDLVAAVLYFVAGLPVPFAIAAGLLIGVLAGIVESLVASRKIAAIEMQLADSIDLMVGALQAGSALLKAFDAALAEAKDPLRQELQELTGKIRLGESPQNALNNLAARVPLETFRLFCVSLSVHWETGGALSSALMGVARSIRDRIEMARRVRAQSVEVQISVAVVLLICYGLGVVMYNANPEQLIDFLTSSIGSYIGAGVIALQAAGVFWVFRLSTAKY